MSKYVCHILFCQWFSITFDAINFIFVKYFYSLDQSFRKVHPRKIFRCEVGVEVWTFFNTILWGHGVDLALHAMTVGFVSRSKHVLLAYFMSMRFPLLLPSKICSKICFWIVIHSCLHGRHTSSLPYILKHIWFLCEKWYIYHSI